MIYDIFISYRRNSGETTAVLLKSELSHLGYNVFLDFDDLPVGGNFEEKIQEVIKSSKLFLFLYSSGCLDRCKDKKDILRREIECAIRNGKQILTLNVNLATVYYAFPPKGMGIPKAIVEKLGKHNFLDFFTGQYKQNSLNRLSEFLATTEALGFQSKKCMLKILSEIDATLIVDGKEWTSLRANTTKIIQIDYGKYDVVLSPICGYFESTKHQELVVATPSKDFVATLGDFPTKAIHTEFDESNFESMSAADIREKGWEYQLENNLPMAVKCWEMAADLGDPAAQYSIGYNYAKGDFLPRDEVKAFEWYQKSARKGDSRAQFLLGDAYYYGSGTICDYESAVKWYKKASEQGNAKALY
ncbi:MAG: toll/interleukin-1 receptor domain-containing protein, partial [Muribaculaceae bacterium]